MIHARKVYTESRQIYVLARRGYRCLEGRAMSRDLGFVDAIDLRVFEHDRAVTDLRLALEPAVGLWKSERELRHERPGSRVADAIIELQGRSITLEFENSDKGAERYRAIFLDYAGRPAGSPVLYVLRDQDRLRALSQIFESLNKQRLGLDLGRISFALERAVLEQKLDAPVLNLKQGSIKIAALAA